MMKAMRDLDRVTVLLALLALQPVVAVLAIDLYADGAWWAAVCVLAVNAVLVWPDRRRRWMR